MPLIVRVALLAWLAGAVGACAQTSLRAQEIAQCLPQEVATWGDGQDRPAVASQLLLAYRHDGAPAWFGATQVLGMVQRAAQAWSDCGIGVQVQALEPGARVPPGAVLVLWSDTAASGNFGLANLRTHSLALGPAAFRLLNQRNPAHPAADTLQMVVSHEMGHFFGLMAHSRRCVDVMSYYDNGKGERCFTRDGPMPATRGDYRALLPTACDIARCRALNSTPLALGRR
ncbi:MAG: hypothetical protein V4795_19710 [Pseudomonadota bacterium]